MMESDQRRSKIVLSSTKEKQSQQISQLQRADTEPNLVNEDVKPESPKSESQPISNASNAEKPSKFFSNN